MKKRQLNQTIKIKLIIIIQINILLVTNNKQFIYSLDSCWEPFDPQLTKQCGKGNL